MPKPRVSKHEYRTVASVPGKDKDDDANIFGARDGSISIRVTPNGANIRGRAKAGVEDGAAQEGEANGNGKSELIVEVSDCDCAKFKGTITVRATHKLGYTARLAGLTASAASATGLAESLGEQTTLTLNIRTAAVNAGSDTHKSENGEKIEVSGEGAATGEIKGATVNGKGNIKFDAATTTTTEVTRAVTTAETQVDSGTILKSFTKTFPLQCGVNRFSATSDLEMTLVSAVIRNPDGTEKQTPVLESRVEFNITNQLEAALITITDCDGNPDELTIPNRTVALADRVIIDGLVADTQFANIPGALLTARDDELDDALMVLGNSQDAEIFVRSSNPAVLQPVEPRQVAPAGESEQPLLFRPLKAGTAKITIASPDLDFEQVQTVNVVDFADLQETVSVQPQSIEVAQGGIGILKALRVLSRIAGKGQELDMKIADRDIARLVGNSGFPNLGSDLYVAIVGGQPGSTSLNIKIPSTRERTTIPIEVIPQEMIRLDSLPQITLQVGQVGTLFVRISHMLLQPVYVDVRVSSDDILCPVTRKFLIPSQQDTGVIMVSGVSPGRATLSLDTHFGAGRCIDVRVLDRPET